MSTIRLHASRLLLPSGIPSGPAEQQREEK
jgi:hypothetical protein